MLIVFAEAGGGSIRRVLNIRKAKITSCLLLNQLFFVSVFGSSKALTVS